MKDSLRLLPYALGVAVTPHLTVLVAAARRHPDWAWRLGRRLLPWLAVLACLGVVGLVIDLDGVDSSVPGGLAVMFAAVVTFVAAAALHHESAHQASRVVRRGSGVARPGRAAWWLQAKSVALAVGAGVAIDNTGGVIGAELRLLATFVLLAACMALVIGAGLGHRETEPGPRPRRPETWAVALTTISAVGVTFDAILIMT